MEKNKYVQAGEIYAEQQQVKELAADLRYDIETIAKRYERVPSAGITCNLLALVDAWETQQVSQLEEQFNAL